MHTVHTAERINGLPRTLSTRQAFQFDRLSDSFLGRHCPGIRTGSDLVYVTDPAEPPAIDEQHVAAGLHGLDATSLDKLHRAASRRQSGHLGYVAAHLLMHDSDAQLEPLFPPSAALMPPKRIISLGAKSERPFYNARMACRENGLEIPAMVPETAQLFTHHDLPPYFSCRGGEPGIHQLQLLDGPPLEHNTPSVHRDLTYLQAYVRGDFS